MTYATYVDTRFCWNSAGSVSLEKCYKCENCNLHLFEHLFIDDVAICPYCGTSVLRKE